MTHKNITADEIITDIRITAQNLGVDNITFSLYNKHGSFSQGPLERIFGSTANAIKAAGFDGGKVAEYSKEHVIKEICRVFGEHKTKHLSMRKFSKSSGIADNVIRRLFKNWEIACVEAGFEKHLSERILGKEYLINTLKDAAKISGGRSLSCYDYEKYSDHDRSVISYNFGSWSNALSITGLTKKPSKQNYSDEELIAYLKKFYQEFGFVPTKRDLAHTEFYPSDKVYYARFSGKSWAEILSLAGLKSPNQYKGYDGYYYDSIAEMKLANKLYSGYTKYESHKKVCLERQWTCDFYLQDINLWVEYDGLEHFRKKPEQYKEKIQFYKDNNYNFVELLEGDDIFEKCNLYLPVAQPEIKLITFNEADAFLQRVHYLSNATRGSRYYGAFINDKLVGVICVGTTANPKEKALAITRIAWLDIVRNNRNFGSFFISRVLREIKKEGYSGPVVSWSDPRFHDGTLYKACNFEKIEAKNRSDYVYVDADGNERHKSYCRVPAGQSEPEYAKFLGLIKIRVPPKQKWRILV